MVFASKLVHNVSTGDDRGGKLEAQGVTIQAAHQHLVGRGCRRGRRGNHCRKGGGRRREYKRMQKRKQKKRRKEGRRRDAVIITLLKLNLPLATLVKPLYQLQRFCAPSSQATNPANGNSKQKERPSPRMR